MGGRVVPFEDAAGIKPCCIQLRDQMRLSSPTCWCARRRMRQIERNGWRGRRRCRSRFVSVEDLRKQNEMGWGWGRGVVPPTVWDEQQQQQQTRETRLERNGLVMLRGANKSRRWNRRKYGETEKESEREPENPPPHTHTLPPRLTTCTSRCVLAPPSVSQGVFDKITQQSVQDGRRHLLIVIPPGRRGRVGV